MKTTIRRAITPYMLLACLFTNLSLRAQRFPARSTSGEPYPLALVEPQPMQFRQFEVANDGTMQLINPLHSAVIRWIQWGGPVDRIQFIAKSNEAPEFFGAEIHSNQQNLPMAPHSLEFDLRHWTVADGLPSAKIRSLARTRDGFLWIGTVTGLARFDGVEFEVFDEKNSNALRENGSVIRGLGVDEADRLWVGTGQGMLCWAGDMFVPFSGQDRLQGRRVNDLAAAKGGGVWAGLADGLVRVDLDSFDEFVLPARGPVNAVFEAKDGVLYFSIGSQIFSRDSNGMIEELRVNFPAFPKEWGSKTNWEISDLLSDDAGTIWIGTNLGLWLFNPKDADSGLMSLDPADLNLQTPHRARLASFGSLGVVSTSQLRQGGILFRPEDDGYAVQNFGQDLRETLAVLVDDEGSIWFGAREGLSQIRLKPCATLAFDIGSIFQGPQTIAEDRKGGVWISGRFLTMAWRGTRFATCYTALGTQMNHPLLGYMLEKHRNPSQFPPYMMLGETATPGQIGHSHQLAINACIRRSDGSWLAATSDGLHVIRDDLGCERVESAPGGPIDVLAETADGSILMDVRDVGLGLLAGDQFDIIEAESTFGRVLCLTTSDTRSGIWVGTDKGYGIVIERRLVRLDMGSDGPDTSIFGIVEDLHGRIWLNHSNGLTWIRLHENESFSTETVRPLRMAHLGAEQGITSLEAAFAAPGSIRGSDGRLWFLKRNGAVMVDPSQFPEAPPPQVFVRNLSAVEGPSERRLHKNSLSKSDADHLRFRFTSTSLHSPERVRLEYRLDGYDTDWRMSETPRRADYVGLGPGDYRFRVRAQNHEGLWSEKEATLTFSIIPALWQRRAFQLTCAGCVGGMVAGGWRLVRRRFEARNRRALEKERTRIARDIHDHLGAALAASQATLGDVIDRKANTPLQELRELVWEIHPTNDSLPAVTDFVANFSARYLQVAGIRLDLDLPALTPSWPIDPEFRRNLAAILKEILRNVVEHSTASEVIVKMETLASRIVLYVQDDGCGFDLDAVTVKPMGGPTGGNGLRNLRSRTQELGGECLISSSLGAGTTVRVSLPFRKTSSAFRTEIHS